MSQPTEQATPKIEPQATQAPTPKVQPGTGQAAPSASQQKKPEQKKLKPFDSLTKAEQKAIQATAGVANNFAVFGLDQIIKFGADIAGYEVVPVNFATMDKRSVEYVKHVEWKKKLDDAMARVLYWALQDYADHPLIMLGMLICSRPMMFKYIKKAESQQMASEKEPEKEPEKTESKPKRTRKTKAK